jgi:hypothetical protein
MNAETDSNPANLVPMVRFFVSASVKGNWLCEMKETNPQSAALEIGTPFARIALATDISTPTWPVS